MKNFAHAIAMAFALATTLSLAACSDPDDQQGDPTDPTQRAKQQEERELRQQSAQQDTNSEQDPAAEYAGQPAPAQSELRPQEDIQGQNQVEEFTQEQAEEHAELRTYLTAINRRTAADSADQCAAFAFGEKACGGPESYVVYSQKDMSEEDIAKIEKSAERYRELDALMKAAQGVMSTCDITPEPQVALEEGHCVAQQAPAL